MCQSKAEGGKRCAAHGNHHAKRRTYPVPHGSQSTPGGLPLMPYDYEPERTRVSRWITPVLSDKERRFFWYRDRLGFKGAIDQDGFPVPEADVDPILKALR